MSHPIPLHPDADLAVVLDDMRQSVAAWGDEGLVTRFFRASICLMLLSILDTLIDLLADFRAGRLPPLLPAEDEPARRVGFQPTIATQCDPTNAPPAPAASAQGTKPRTRSLRIEDPCGDPADAPEPSVAQAPHRLVSIVAPPRPPIFRYRPAPCVLAGHPSHVPRRRAVEFADRAAAPTRAHFVAISQ